MRIICGNTLRAGEPMRQPETINTRALAERDGLALPSEGGNRKARLIIRCNRLRALRARTAAGK